MINRIHGQGTNLDGQVVSTETEAAEVGASTTTRRRVQKRPSAAPPRALRTSFPTSQLARYSDAWTLDCRASNASPRYIESAEFLTGKLLWWARREKIETIEAASLRLFILYIQTSHELPEGRWGERGETRQIHEATTTGRGYKPASVRYRGVSPRTTANYWRLLRTFCGWLVAQGQLDTSPFATLKQPIARPDQIRPFTEDELRSLLDGAACGKYPRRDRAMILFLLDTGLRASELCALSWGNVDTLRRAATVVGKGNKKRECYWSKETAMALWQWAQESGRDGKDKPVFASMGGNRPGTHLTRGGLQKIIGQLGEAAGIEGARCSPHTLRHTFAVMFLRAGGSQFALMDALGHTNLEMSRRYVQFTGADRAAQARQFSPVASLGKG